MHDRHTVLISKYVHVPPDMGYCNVSGFHFAHPVPLGHGLSVCSVATPDDLIICADYLYSVTFEMVNGTPVYISHRRIA